MRARVVGLLMLAVLACVSLIPSPAAAQEETPVVFLHGLKGNPDKWVGAASRLSGPIAIGPVIPNLEWRRSYPDQADALRYSQEMSALPGSAVLVGHSNGGIVAREWTKIHKVAGVVTLGTPHRGAPLLPHYFQWAGFQAATPSLLNEVLRVFRTATDWSWTFAYVTNALGWISDFSIWSVVVPAATLGLDGALPVTAEMHPDSWYLNSLNSPDNMVRESSWIPSRVGIVSVARNFYWAGPARAGFPDVADNIAEVMYGAAFGLSYWGAYIISGADPSDFRATDQGLALLTAAGFVLSIDPTYCRLLSTADASRCVENDGVVPYTSQEYPGAPNIYMGSDNEGPAHIKEQERSDDALYNALVNFTHVPLRGMIPAPAPPPMPPADPPADPSDPGPSFGSDGGSSEGGHTGSSNSGPSVLYPNQWLRQDEYIISNEGFYFLLYQGDGNLVLYDDQWSALWASNTSGTYPGAAIMQGDGNFVIYDGDGIPIWATGTNDHPGAGLVIQGDGNVVMYDPDFTVLWATNTSR